MVQDLVNNRYPDAQAVLDDLKRLSPVLRRSSQLGV